MGIFPGAGTIVIFTLLRSPNKLQIPALIEARLPLAVIAKLELLHVYRKVKLEG